MHRLAMSRWHPMEKVLNFDEKYFTVFAPPRSGSTWLFSFLTYYLKKHKKFDRFYDGYFNKNHYFSEDKRSKVWSTYSSNAKGRFTIGYRLNELGELSFYRYYKSPSKNIRDPNHRLQLLKDTTSNVCLKIHPDQLESNALEFLLKYPHIMLERKDTWQQLLSYLLAGYTKNFIIVKGQQKVEVKYNSIEADLMNARRFCMMLDAYEKIKSRNSIIITYEEIFKDPLPVLTRRLGLPIKRKDIEEFEQQEDHPIKQEYGNKEHYFKNIKKIRRVYERYRRPPKHH
jgi:hypothetical protein